MVVRLRLAMHGRRHNHVFHLVAINSRKARDAKPIEMLGVYDPAMRLDEAHKTVEWSVNRIKYWLGVGAQPSKTVVRLLEVGGVLPPDSKYHPKNLGPRVPSPTIPLDSLKAREIWDSYVTPEDLLQREDTTEDKISDSAVLPKSEGNIPSSSPSPLRRKSPTLPSRSKS